MIPAGGCVIGYRRRASTAVLRLADQLDIRGHDTRNFSVRGMLREISASLRNLLPSDPGSRRPASTARGTWPANRADRRR